MVLLPDTSKNNVDRRMVSRAGDADVAKRRFDSSSFVPESFRKLPFCGGRGSGNLIVLPLADTVTHFGGVTDAMYSGQCEWGENFRCNMRESSGLCRCGTVKMDPQYNEYYEERQTLLFQQFLFLRYFI